MNSFLTGATGFIGGRLARQLVQAGHHVVALVREPSRCADLAALGIELRRGDVFDRASVRDAMRGADTVFHLAGWYALGRLDVARMQAINIEGARHTLEGAAELGVRRIVHTSTVGVFGNTRGQVVDENYRVGLDALASEYERTKWAAHYGVAVRLQNAGAPLVIVQPGGVTGAGDTSPHAQVFEYFLQRLPVMLGERSGLTWAHVDDIAHGHRLAAERGRAGESYILAGPALTYRQIFELCERITGIPSPRIWAPGWVAGALSRLAAILEPMGVRLPLSADGLATLADYTFWAGSDKARRELGWEPRPVEAVIREVLEDAMARAGSGR